MPTPEALSADELRAWLRLVHSPGLSPSAARRLLAAYGSPERALAAGPGGWREVGGAEAAAALQQPRIDHDAVAETTSAWLSADRALRHVITVGDAAYPPALLETADPPLLVYAHGRPELLARPSLAIVGSRHATPGGLDNARAFARHLSASGIVVVSGLAQGIDGAAHEGALEGATGSGGGTIAVVGTGLDRVYPRSHHTLAHRIAAGTGLMLSEFALGTLPLKSHFPRRNRIIAGMTLGTLVVEAAVQSGSLITARLAVECGREVFAIPGSIHSPQARGCHRLIKDGAKLVETADDILLELRLPAAGAALKPSSLGDAGEAWKGDGDPLMSALGHDPVTLDALSARLGWPTPELQARLLELELDGRLVRLPGGLFQRRAES
ncbi:DNA-processing protein DprA [Ideonella sp. DXS29W]|uniref:DNA-processing protein DprA n=1 Tax=Ideonella lacteola TaxID=2984193 RepID=A0ABU9BU63_9BURK